MLTNNGTEKVKSNGVVWAMGAAAIGAAVLAMGGQAAQATFTSGLVDVQYMGDGGAAGAGNNGTPGSQQATGAAVIGSTGDAWNTVTEGGYTNSVAVNVPAGTTPAVTLDNISGSASGVTLLAIGTGNSSGTYIGAAAAGNVSYLSPATTVNFNLLNGNVSTYGTTSATPPATPKGNVTVATIGGLDPALTYDLYLENGLDDTTYTVAGATILTGTVNTYTDANTSAWVSGNDYYEFTLAPDSSGNISLAYIYAGGSAAENGQAATLSGFQITPVPEPAALGLLAVGGLGLLLLKRRTV